MAERRSKCGFPRKKYYTFIGNTEINLTLIGFDISKVLSKNIDLLIYHKDIAKIISGLGR